MRQHTDHGRNEHRSKNDRRTTTQNAEEGATDAYC
jgi:hypothetical protein